MNSATIEKGKADVLHIGIGEGDRGQVARILGRLLADEFVLYAKVRNFHWNVEGPRFAQLHKFFEELYEDLDEIVDEVAERIRALDKPSPGSLAEFLKSTRLKEAPGGPLESGAMVAALLQDYEHLVRELRPEIDACIVRFHDVGTGDFLTGILEKHEKTAWMLRSHLRGS
ncbi:MAG TPA: DNA starvation/stationary phase protection protein [Elusimicrobiota bacterium]|nr:DNA starvation/stationary phase protection protein [Elusimicrobiota bacterium]